MKELETIQKKEKLNNVYVMDEQGPGGANHHYIITKEDEILNIILFQKGPRKDENS